MVEHNNNNIINNIIIERVKLQFCFLFFVFFVSFCFFFLREAGPGWPTRG